MAPLHYHPLADLIPIYLKKYEQEYTIPPSTIQTMVMPITEQHRINIITGAPSVGKTAYAIQNAVMLAGQGIYLIYFSYEMSATTISIRLLSHLGKIDKQTIEQRQVNPTKIRQIIQNNASIFSHIAISDSGDEKTIRHDIETFVRDPDITNLMLFCVFDYLQRIPVFTHEDPRNKVEKTLNLLSKIISDCQSPRPDGRGLH